MGFLPHKNDEIMKEVLRCAQSEKDTVTISKKAVRYMLRMVVLNSSFDENYYLEKNKDVAQGLEKGGLSSGIDHFADHGIFEDREYCMNFSREFYLRTYPDIMRAVRSGKIKDPEDHFKTKGYAEGRYGTEEHRRMHEIAMR